MSQTYDYEKKPSQSSASVQPTATYLQTRGFAPLQTDLDEDATFRPSGYTENFLEKIINQRSPESSNPPVQRKPHHRLKALQAQRMAIQAKLNIGEPNDKYEQEADDTASKVVQQINSPTNLALQNQPTENNSRSLQRSSTINNSHNQTIANHQNANTVKISSTEQESIQRLALQYGNLPPIPEDAKNLAAHQDGTRGTKVSVQQISGDGAINISNQVYKDMVDAEDIFLVAHGRPALGDQPAMLESGDGSTINGADVAGIFNTIRSGLKSENKSLGEFKIEACMSSLSRKTKGGKFGGYFVKEKPSLLDDTKNSLKKLYKIKDIGLKGNLGFSAGSELEDGVENTTPEGTEVGLLDPLLTGIRDAGDNLTKASPMIADALNIIAKQKSLLNAFDKDVPNYKDLHNQKSTADFMAKSFAAFKTDKPPDYTLESIISGLVKYVKSKAQK
jgi:hypothetical protein